jgi:hypothetical protein
VVQRQRTGPELTVFVGGSSFQVDPGGENAMVDLTNAAWDAVSA